MAVSPGDCAASGIGLREVLASGDVFAKIGLFKGFADTLLASDELRRSFYVYENTVSSLYEACKPEVRGRDKVRVVAALAYLRGVTEALVEQLDIDKVMLRVDGWNDRLIAADLGSDGAEIASLSTAVRAEFDRRMKTQYEIVGLSARLRQTPVRFETAEIREQLQHIAAGVASLA